MKKEPDCVAHLGLDETDQAMLTGFSSRAFAALVHLREAWAVADRSNMAAIEAAIRALMQGHSFADHREEVVKVLRHGLGPDTSAGLIGRTLIDGGTDALEPLEALSEIVRQWDAAKDPQSKAIALNSPKLWSALGNARAALAKAGGQP